MSQILCGVAPRSYSGLLSHRVIRARDQDHTVSRDHLPQESPTPIADPYPIFLTPPEES